MAGLLDDVQEYARRSGRNLTGLLEWLGGGAEAGAEPLMGLLRGDALDEPLLPTTDSGGRIGAVASAVASGIAPESAAGKAAVKAVAKAEKAAAKATEKPSAPLSTDPPDIPIGASASPPKHPFIGRMYSDQLQALKDHKAGGGDAAGIRVVKNGNMWVIEEAPHPSAVPPNGQVSNPVGPPATLPGNAGVANPGGPLVPNNAGATGAGPAGPPAAPPPFARPVAGPPSPVAVPAGALTDPEGRMLTAPLIAGIRQPGGVDYPLSMGEERWLANRLFNLGVHDDPSFMANTGYKGQVSVNIPGGPNTMPGMRMTIDSRLSHDQYPKTFRHEGGHGLDFASERTNRTNRLPHSETNNIPPAVQSELAKASEEMRPDLWASHAPGAAPYRNRSSELMADALRYYKEDPQRFKALYPQAAKFIRDIINDDPLLSQHIQFNVMAPNPLGGLLAPAPDDDKRKR